MLPKETEIVSASDYSNSELLDALWCNVVVADAMVQDVDITGKSVRDTIASLIASEIAEALRPHYAGKFLTLGRTPSPLHNMGWCWISSRQLPVASMQRFVHYAKEMLPHIITDSSPIGNAGRCCRKGTTLHSNSGLSNVRHIFSGSLWTSVKRAWSLGKNLPILVFSGNVGNVTSPPPPHGACIWQFGQKHAQACPSIAHFVVLWQYSRSSLPKEQIMLLLLFCCPSMAPSTSPGILTCLLVSSLCSWHYAGTQEAFYTW